MKTALIDYEAGSFFVTVSADGRRVEIAWDEYPALVALAVRAGVPRNRVTLTPAAQAAAATTCFGGAP